MKNVLKVLGIIALVAAIGFSMVSCGGDDEEGPLVWPETLAKYDENGEAYGTWKNDTGSDIYCFLAKKDEKGKLITGIKIAGTSELNDLDHVNWVFYLDESIKASSFTGHYLKSIGSGVWQHTKCTVTYVFDTDGKLSFNSSEWTKITGGYTKEGDW